MGEYRRAMGGQSEKNEGKCKQISNFQKMAIRRVPMIQKAEKWGVKRKKRGNLLCDSKIMLIFTPSFTGIQKTS
jgi:hypothetical protein